MIGTAAGPVAGGLLTEAFSWQAIFVVQVPFAVLAVPAALAVPVVPRPRRPAPSGRPPEPDPGAPVGRAHAALFLLVLLLVEGWRRSPATAALTVSVVPLAALAARPLARLLQPSASVEVAVGCFLVAGGLTGSRPAVGRSRVDNRSPGPGGPRARADRGPTDLTGDGDAAAASPDAGWTIGARTSASSWDWRS